MKSIYTFFFITLLFTTTLKAQEKDDFSIFIGPSYQLIHNSDLGVNVGLEYFLTTGTAIAPSFSYYFSAKGIRTYAFNADVRYYLNTSSRFHYFAIGGFSYLMIKNTLTTPALTDSNIGINAGGGFVVALNDKIGLLGQLKYDSSGAASIEPMLGVTYKF